MGSPHPPPRAPPPPHCSSTIIIIGFYFAFADFILTYTDEVSKKGKEDTDERQEKRRKKRNTFIKNCEAAGLLFEHQDCSVS